MGIRHKIRNFAPHPEGNRLPIRLYRHNMIRRKILFIISLITMAFAVSDTVSANVNIYFNLARHHDTELSVNSDYEYRLHTTGTDPYVVSLGLPEALPADCRTLEFEYRGTDRINNLQVYYGFSFSGDRSSSLGALEPSEDWIRVRFDLGEDIAKAGWGNDIDIIRLDFGTKSEKTIEVRHARFVTPDDESEWAYDGALPGLQDALHLGLPVLDFITETGEEPVCSVIYPPTGSIGIGITDVNQVPGRLRRYEPDGTVSYDSGDYVKGESGMTLKVRGNTSGLLLRKPFKIKLQKKNDLLVRGNKDFNDKNWVLINDFDMMHRNGHWMNKIIGMDWAPQCEYVNVMVNGDFRGVYLLCEAVERNNKCRINIGDTGFVTELDAYWWNENGEYFESPNYSPRHNYTFKFPDFDEVSEEGLVYAKECMDQYERAMDQEDYPDYIDVESFARWILGHDILGTYDWCGSNMYFSKYDNTPDSKLRRPLMWDFDSTEQTADRWSDAHIYYYKKLFDNPNKALADTFHNLWTERGYVYINDMAANLSRYQRSDASKAYDASIRITSRYWGIEYPMSGACTDRSIKWYVSRRRWMDNAIAEYEPQLSGVSEVSQLPTNSYKISGRTIISPWGSMLSVSSIDGRLIGTGTETVVPCPGIYIIRANGESAKVCIR